MCAGVLPPHMSVLQVLDPQAAAAGSFELPPKGWELNPGPLKEQPSR